MENIVEKANRIAEECHYDQIYKSTGGAFYESHLVPVWDLLKEVGFPEKTQAVGLLHDILEDTELALGELRELFGEIQDPRYSIFNATTTLSDMGRMTNYLDNLYNTNKMIQAPVAAGGKGERGAFWNSRQEAMKGTNNVLDPKDIVSLDPLLGRLTSFKDEVGEKLLNPLKGMYTTRAIANALANANGITGGLAGVVRGRKDASSAEQMTMWLYRNFLLK